MQRYCTGARQSTPCVEKQEGPITITRQGLPVAGWPVGANPPASATVTVLTKLQQTVLMALHDMQRREVCMHAPACMHDIALSARLANRCRLYVLHEMRAQTDQRLYVLREMRGQTDQRLYVLREMRAQTDQRLYVLREMRGQTDQRLLRLPAPTCGVSGHWRGHEAGRHSLPDSADVSSWTSTPGHDFSFATQHGLHAVASCPGCLKGCQSGSWCVLMGRGCHHVQKGNNTYVSRSQNDLGQPPDDMLHHEGLIHDALVRSEPPLQLDDSRHEVNDRLPVIPL
eukprot:366043-Chlamydomonas_euryale.AAC.4